MAQHENDQPQLAYVGFWIRLIAFWIDVFVLTLVLIPLIFVWMDQMGGHWWATFNDVTFQWVINLLPVIATLIFWKYRSATPGKMVFGATIVDAQTGLAPTMGWLVVRYFAYLISFLPLGLGFLWIAFDPKKQGWHDKLAGTVLVRMVPPSTENEADDPNG